MKPYRIKFDFKNTVISRIARACVLDINFMDKLCLIENPSGLFAQNIPSFDMVVFDDKYGDIEDIECYCQGILINSPDTVFIHISNKSVANPKLHLIAVHQESFSEYFKHLLSFCFTTFLVRHSLVGSAKVIDLASLHLR